MAQPDDNRHQRDIEFEICRSAAERRRRTEILGPLERFVYSLISASALTVVLIGFVSLGQSARHGGPVQPVGFSQEIAGPTDSTYPGESDASQTRPN